jgi:hypothetical protein
MNNKIAEGPLFKVTAIGQLDNKSGKVFSCIFLHFKKSL